MEEPEIIYSEFFQQILLVKRIEDVLEQAFEGGCPWRQLAKL